MTKTWIAALMAAASLVPAMALAQDGPDRQRGGWRGQQQGGERFQPREGGVQPQREQVERAPRSEPQPQPQPQPQVRAQAQVDANRRGWNGQRGDRGDRGWNGDRQQAQVAPQPRPNPGGWQDRGQRADRGNDQRRDWNREGQRADRGQWNDRGNDRANGRDPRRDQVRQQWNRSDADWRDHARADMGFSDRAAWNRGWRGDDRYDYGQYRSANRGAYRMPRYYAPSGWGAGYRRFSVGVSLNQSLWGENYWIEDPYDYRLPAAYGPYRWVRYYNDALLVDIRNGRVVDSVYDIFW